MFDAELLMCCLQIGSGSDKKTANQPQNIR
jgi:hypothetical protein